MTTYTWQNGVSGDWSTAADWTPNGIPGSGDTVDIGIAGAVATSPWTVTVANEAAAALLFDPMGPGTLAVYDLLDVGGAASFDGGTVEMAPGATLAIAGTLTLGVAGGGGGSAVLTLGTGDLVAAESLVAYDGSTVVVGPGAVALGNAVAVAGEMVVGSDSSFTGDSGTIDGNVVNDGGIGADAVVAGEAAGSLTINGTLTNNNLVTLDTGAALLVNGDFINNYALLIDAGSALGVAGNATLDYAGYVQLGADALLSIGYSFTIESGLTADGGGDVIAVNGALDVTRAFSAVDAAITAGVFEFAGSISIDGGSLTQTGTGVNSLADGNMVLSNLDWTVAQFAIGVGPGGFYTTPVVLEVANETFAVTDDLTVGIPAQGYARPEDNGVNGVLKVDAGASVTTGRLVLVQGSVTGAGSVVVGSASAVAGAVAVGSDGTVAASGITIDMNVLLNGALVEQLAPSYWPVVGDYSVIDVSLTGQGTVSVLDGLSAPPSLGTSDVGSSLELAAAAGFSGAITLDNECGLVLDGTAMPTGRITVDYFPPSNSYQTWGSDAYIDLSGITYEAFNVPQYNAATGLLVVGAATLNVGTTYAPGDFTASPDSGTGTLVVLPVTPCYAAGTGIATPDGDVAVEALRPGDAVLTREGPRPVRWVGRFTVDLDRHPAPAHAAPIRIRAHAMADNLPARDLLLSPDHAVLVGDVLMQAQSLVNGATILREPPRGRVTYVHVELDRHAILFAEGLQAESYLDTGNRAAFAGEQGVRPLFPDLSARTWAADSCAPLVLDGPLVTAAHARLRDRAETLGHQLTDDPALTVFVDGVALFLRRDAAGAWCAKLPEGRHTVRLASRGFVPMALDRRCDDRRLGVAVASLRLGGRALAPSGEGWHAPEHGWCWTDGDATLPVTCRRPAWLRIRLVAAGARYWLPAPPQFRIGGVSTVCSNRISHSAASRR